MKHRILLLWALLCLLSLPVLAQTAGQMANDRVWVTAAPSGSCLLPRDSLTRQVISSGDLWYCRVNVWTLLTSSAGGGSLTVNSTPVASGGANRLLFENGVNIVSEAAGIATDGASKIMLGVAGSSVGSIDFRNLTSGSITLQPATGALGTVTLTMPAATDTLAALAATQTFSNKILNNTNSFSGYFDVTRIASPSNPAAGYLRVYADNFSGELSCVDSAGADCLPSGGGGGTGDFSSNTTTSVDNEVVLFSSTTGKLGKRATTTGLAKLTSGVLSAAVAGTDYEVPLTFSTGLTRSTNTITVNNEQIIAKLTNLTSNGYVTTSAGDGTLSVSTASGILDSIGTSRGSVLYRGASAWAALAPGTSGLPLASNGTGADPSYQALGNSAIASGANITLSKLAALTASRLVVSDGSGVISASSVTATEAGYLSGVTSALQTQIDGKVTAVLPTRTVTTTATLAPATDGILLASTAGGSYTITLNSPAAGNRREFIIKKTTTDGNAITLSPASGTIDGGASHIFSGVSGSIGQAVRVLFDGTNWWVIGQ